MEARNQYATSAMVLMLVLFMGAGVKASELSGEELFLAKACNGCHSINGRGGQSGPALDTVGDRYTAAWLYTWLRDPAAVKPGTQMPNLNLTDDEGARLVFFLEAMRSGARPVSGTNRIVDEFTPAYATPELNPDSPENDYLSLGTEDSYIDAQRFTLQDQIQSFIPPLYEPAFTQAAFVLPPGAVRTAMSFRGVETLHESDVAGQDNIGARFVEFDLERNFVDFDFFLGLNNNYTLRVNVPFVSSSVQQQLNPGFLDPISVFPNGSTSAFGDVQFFLKKKFFDQGNYPFSLAGMGALRLPTGANDERFNARTTVNINSANMLLPLPAVDSNGMPVAGSADGTFRRFSDDGRLPATLQPGLGTLGGSLGVFATRVFEGNSFVGRGSVHAGALYELRPGDDGIDPGNQLTVFASVVKPLIGDRLSVDFTYLFRDQQNDAYDGLMAVPTMPPMMPPMAVKRPSFSGGTTQFAGVSLIAIPNPLFRLTLSALFRLNKPELGPSPSSVIRLNFQYTFASGLYQKGKGS